MNGKYLINSNVDSRLHIFRIYGHVDSYMSEAIANVLKCALLPRIRDRLLLLPPQAEAPKWLKDYINQIVDLFQSGPGYR